MTLFEGKITAKPLFTLSIVSQPSLSTINIWLKIEEAKVSNYALEKMRELLSDHIEAHRQERGQKYYKLANVENFFLELQKSIRLS